MESRQPIVIEALVPREEVARRLGVTVSCIQKWQRMRRIPSYRFGRRCVRFDFQEVVAILAKYKTPAFQRFKQRRPKNLVPPSRPLVQGTLPIQDDPGQLDLFNLPPQISPCATHSSSRPGGGSVPGSGPTPPP